MKCYYCEREAVAKLGTAKGNLFNAVFGGKTWDKKEIYVCKIHYERLKDGF